MNQKRILTLLLAALLVLPTLAACGESQTETADTGTAGVAGETESESETGYADGLPERDFAGQVFTTLTGSGYASMLVGEELTGEVLNDALYNRDRIVEGRFNAVIEPAYMDDVQLAMQNAVASGDDIYSVADNGYVALGIDVAQGWYLNARDVPYLNFDQPWYSQEVNSELTYKDRTFVFVSDYSLSNIHYADCLLWNLDMAEEYDLENIYDVVREYRWTKEKMEEMCLNVYKDINGDGVKDEEDQYGIVMETKGDPTNIFRNFGHRILQRQSDGTFKDVFYDEALISQVEWMYNIAHNEQSVYCKDEWNLGYNMFVKGKTLLGYAFIHMVGWGLRDLDIDYAILPRPLWDENQEKYYSTIAGSAEATVFVRTLQDREFAGIIMEALASTSHEITVPAYYENVLSYKLSRDEATLDMLELIMDGRTYDFGYVYGAFESHGGGAAFWLCDVIRGNGDITSYYQARKNNWENYMAKVYNQFESYKDDTLE